MSALKQGTRIAVVDVGTNTAQLLVAEADGSKLVVLRQERRFVRLGEGVDALGRINAAALVRLRVVLEEYAAIAVEEGVTEGLVAGTSASRDASNRGVLEPLARAACRWPYRILTGQREAVLTFAGATSLIRPGAAPVVVIDVGGGSTELVHGRMGPPRELLTSKSLDMGSVRVTERYFGRTPPGKDEADAAREFIDAMLRRVSGRIGASPVLVGSAGTAVALAALHYGTVDDGSLTATWPPITRQEVSSWSERLLGLDAEAVLQLSPAVLGGREDVFAAGVLILERAMQALGSRELQVSAGGVRHGLALDLLRLK